MEILEKAIIKLGDSKNYYVDSRKNLGDYVIVLLQSLENGDYIFAYEKKEGNKTMLRMLEDKELQLKLAKVFQ